MMALLMMLQMKAVLLTVQESTKVGTAQVEILLHLQHAMNSVEMDISQLMSNVKMEELQMTMVALQLVKKKMAGIMLTQLDLFQI
jgi:hypothetical protein